MITVKSKMIKTKAGNVPVLDVRVLGVLVYRKYLHVQQ